MKLTKGHLLTAAGALLSLLLTWVSAVALDVKEKADRVPGLEKQAELTYAEVLVLRQQTTELLIAVYSAIGDLKRELELRAEMEKLKKEAALASQLKEENNGR